MNAGEHLQLFEQTYPYLIGMFLFSLLFNVYEQRNGNWKANLQSSLSNLSMLFTEQLFREVLVKVLLFSGYGFIYEYYHVFEFGNQWYYWLIAFLLIDFIGYVEHYSAHRWNILWAIHEVHHQPEEMNLTVTPRKHWLNGFVKSKFFLPLALLGISPAMFLIVLIASAYYTLFLHTESIRNFGPFNWLFAAPDHHRVHHGRNPQYIDKNFGIVLILWDRLFGTFEPEIEKVEYGITKYRQQNNLFYLNTARFVELWDETKAKKGFLPKITYLFHSPNSVSTKETIVTNKPLQIDERIFYYSVFQLVWAGSFVFFFFLNNPEWGKALSWLLCLNLFISLTNQGFQQHGAWKWIEWTRLFIFLPLAWNLKTFYYYFTLVPSLLSILWLLWLEWKPSLHQNQITNPN